jgi:hypothetical protein
MTQQTCHAVDTTLSNAAHLIGCVEQLALAGSEALARSAKARVGLLVRPRRAPALCVFCGQEPARAAALRFCGAADAGLPRAVRSFSRHPWVAPRAAVEGPFVFAPPIFHGGRCRRGAGFGC